MTGETTWWCPACLAETGRRRYCPPRICYCGHTQCRAYTKPAPSERTAQQRAAAAWGMTQGDNPQ